MRPGDTLSGIAAALAVPGGWPALYTANRAVVGPDPNILHSGTTLTIPGTTTPVRYTVAPGDTLSGIAAALAVPGGWQALYTANRRSLGPNPNLIRAGTVLVTPGRPAVKAPAKKVPAAGSAGAGSSPAASPAAAAPSGSTGSSHPQRPASPAPLPSARSRTPAAGGMPVWLEGTLIAAGLLTLIAFLVEPVLLVSRRRRQAGSAEQPAAAAEIPQPDADADADADAAERITKIVEASYERLIVTYSMADDTVYLLSPPGEDPRSVLRAARLILPEDTYQELAGHLGVPAGWPPD